MPHLVSFMTTKFDASKEEPNPYNPIAGKGLLSWLRGELAKIGWQVSEPDAEDWGWFVVAKKDSASYMIGASGEIVEDTPPTDWIVQVHKNRSLFQKLSGKNELTNDDPLTKEVETIIRRDPAFTKVEVDTSV